MAINRDLLLKHLLEDLTVVLRNLKNDPLIDKRLPFILEDAIDTVNELIKGK